MARADVRIRIRGGVIRVRIGETCIRPVIRITAEQDTSGTTNLLFYHSNQKRFPLPLRVTFRGNFQSFLISRRTYKISCEPVKNFLASDSGLSFSGRIWTSVCPVVPFDFENRVGMSSKKP